MRARLASIFIVLVMAFTMIPAGLVSNNTAQAAPVDVVNCTSLRVGTDAVEIKCTAAGIVVLDTTVNLPPGPTVRVTLPPIRVTTTVDVPGPRTTQTIEVPVPGPTQSVEVTVPVAGPVSTATATVTHSVESTATVTTSPTGQVDNGDGTLVPEPNDPVVSIPNIDTPAQAAGIGLLFLMVVLGLILLGLYLGYILGYKDSDRKSSDFMQAMLDKMKKG